MLIYIAEQLEQRNIPLMKYSAANALQLIGPIFNKFLLCGRAAARTKNNKSFYSCDGHDLMYELNFNQI